MRINSLIACLVILLFQTRVYAQFQNKLKGDTSLGPQIEFKIKLHDFGKIDIASQYAKYRFVFKNAGDKPLHISNVVTSCGCTTPDWTRDAVKPGDSGFVEAKYETINRPGVFKKTITVYSDDTNDPFMHLDIVGDVYKQVPVGGAVVPDYGKLYFSKPTFDFNPLYDNRIDTMRVRLINGSQFSTEFEPLNNLPAYCKISGFPKSLEPGESAPIVVSLDATMIKGYGFGAFQVPVNSNNLVMPNIGLYVTYIRKQYFPKMSARELARAPKITLSLKNDVINFGTHTSGDVIDTFIQITNTGKKDLILHEVYPECSCVRVDIDKNVLKPGESVKVKFSFDTVTKSGQSTQSVWIVSNDPTMPEKYIYLRAMLPKRIQKCLTCPNRDE